MFYEDWGESMVSKSIPVLCVLDIESGNISVLEGVPENVSPGQVSSSSACSSWSLGALPELLPLLAVSHLTCAPVSRLSGPLETPAWCSLVGGMSLSG